MEPIGTTTIPRHAELVEALRQTITVGHTELVEV